MFVNVCVILFTNQCLNFTIHVQSTLLQNTLVLGQCWWNTESSGQGIDMFLYVNYLLDMLTHINVDPQVKNVLRLLRLIDERVFGIDADLLLF